MPDNGDRIAEKIKLAGEASGGPRELGL